MIDVEKPTKPTFLLSRRLKFSKPKKNAPITEA